MPTLGCPDCGQPTTRYLLTPSDIAIVNYYRCDDCGHMFSLPKYDPDAPPRHLTAPRPRKGSGKGAGGGMRSSGGAETYG
jgi:hypothetical protein